MLPLKFKLYLVDERQGERGFLRKKGVIEEDELALGKKHLGIQPWP